MSDVTVSLDSSDLPVIARALTFKKAALQGSVSKKRDAEQQALMDQINLLINTFSNVSPPDAA